MSKNGMPAREDFDIAVSLFARTYRMSEQDVIDQFRPTQSRLRLEQLAVTTSATYNFKALVNQGNPFNTEVRLNLQDTFVPTHVGFYMGAPTSSTDSAWIPQTYLNPFVFGAANAAAMNSIYNGNMSIMLNNDQYVNNWPIMWHWQSPQTQQTAAAGAGSPLDEFDGDSYSLRSMQPFVLLVGSQNIQIQIALQNAPTQVLANSRLMLVYDGILFQNSTVVS